MPVVQCDKHPCLSLNSIICLALPKFENQTGFNFASLHLPNLFFYNAILHPLKITLHLTLQIARMINNKRGRE